MSQENPLATAGDGRDNRGRFAKGNKAGRGNPCAAKAQRLRVALLGATR